MIAQGTIQVIPAQGSVTVAVVNPAFNANFLGFWPNPTFIMRSMLVIPSLTLLVI